MNQEPVSFETSKHLPSSSANASSASLAISSLSQNNRIHASPATKRNPLVDVGQFSGDSPTVMNVSFETGISSETLVEVKQIEDFVSQYLVNFERYHQVSSVKLKRIFLKVLSVAVGAGVGYSWLAPARASCESPVWGDITGYSMLFSYGIASTWTCFELVDYFFTTFPSEYRLRSAILRERSNFLEHLICHFLGLLSAIPVAYVTYTYNKQIPITILDSIVAYAYNTFGLYQLNRQVLAPFCKSYKNSNNQFLADKNQYIFEVTEHIPEYFSELVQPAFKSFKSQASLRVSTLESMHDFFMHNVATNIVFIRNHEKNIILPSQWLDGIPKKSFQYLITGLVATTNAIVLGVLTNSALTSVFSIENDAEKGLEYIAIILVMAATVGLVIFTQEIILSKIFDQLYYLSTSNKNHAVDLSTLVYISLFMVSVASGHTAYYVSKSQLEGTVLNDYRIFLAAMMWAGETFFEGVGLISIAKQSSIILMASLPKLRCLLPRCIEHFDQSTHLAENLLERTEYHSYLRDYGSMLSNCDDETYNLYANKHQLKMLGVPSDGVARYGFFSVSSAAESVDGNSESHLTRDSVSRN